MIQENLVHPSPNRRKGRKAPISAIIMHDTGGHTVEGTLSWFDNPASQVSAHVVIDTDGAIYRVVADQDTAWHAGKSNLWGVERVNDFSLGVELVDDDDSWPYPKAQIASAAEWVAWKVRQYRIPLNRIVGHCDVSPGRKVDPGRDFRWYEFLRDVAGRVTP